MRKIIISSIVILLVSLSFFIVTDFIGKSIEFFIFFILIMIAVSKYLRRLNIDIDEKKSLVLITVLPLISSSFFLIYNSSLGDSYVKSYTLKITPEKSKLLVKESIVFHASGREHAHRIYRYYILNGPMSDMKVLSINCPTGFSKEEYTYERKKEISCNYKNYDFSRKYISRGDYKMEISYEIPRPYVCYDDYCYVQWKVFDDFAIDVTGINISVSNAYDFFTFPKIKENTAIKKGGMLEVNIVVPKTSVSPNGIYIRKYGKYRDYRFVYFIPSLLSDRKFLLLILLILTGIVISIYLVFGKEFEFPDVPSVLHYPPTKRKPYLVNYIFYGDPYKMEDEGPISVVLDLARRGAWKINGDKLIFSGKIPEMDEYEKNVYDTINKIREMFGKDNEISFKKLNEVIRKSKDTKLLSDVIKILKNIENVRAPNVYEDKGGVLLKVLFLVVILFGFFILIKYPMLKTSYHVMLSFGITGLIADGSFDIYTFGRYKKKYARERSSWMAFRRLLNDYSLIKKYYPQDMNSWGEWLVYATSLGCAKNVLKAMKDFKVNLPDIYNPNMKYINLYGTLRLSEDVHSSLIKPRGGSGWSGGGGFGGGFGGGGGGFD